MSRSKNIFLWIKGDGVSEMTNKNENGEWS